MVFLVWCGFSLFLAMAPEGWKSGFQIRWQKLPGLRILPTPNWLSLPCHPEARETSAALLFHLWLFAWQWFKFLLALCWGGGANRIEASGHSLQILKSISESRSSQPADESLGHWFSGNGIVFFVCSPMGNSFWKRLLQIEQAMLLATLTFLGSLPLESDRVQSAYH